MEPAGGISSAVQWGRSRFSRVMLWKWVRMLEKRDPIGSARGGGLRSAVAHGVPMSGGYPPAIARSWSSEAGLRPSETRRELRRELSRTIDDCRLMIDDL